VLPVTLQGKKFFLFPLPFFAFSPYYFFVGTIWRKLKALFGLGGGRKQNPGKHHRKKSGGWRSPEEYHKYFEERYGKPGRIPEDV
jgi:hypothetical protein